MSSISASPAGPELVPPQYAAHAVPSAKTSVPWRDHRNTTEDWEHAEVRSKYRLTEQLPVGVPSTDSLSNCPWVFPRRAFRACIQLPYLSLHIPQEVNLSYQDLGDPYQVKNFHRCLKRLIRCRHLQLIENSLTDLSSITLLKSVSIMEFSGYGLNSLGPIADTSFKMSLQAYGSLYGEFNTGHYTLVH